MGLSNLSLVKFFIEFNLSVKNQSVILTQYDAEYFCILCNRIFGIWNFIESIDRYFLPQALSLNSRQSLNQ